MNRYVLYNIVGSLKSQTVECVCAWLSYISVKKVAKSRTCFLNMCLTLKNNYKQQATFTGLDLQLPLVDRKVRKASRSGSHFLSGTTYLAAH